MLFAVSSAPSVDTASFIVSGFVLVHELVGSLEKSCGDADDNGHGDILAELSFIILIDLHREDLNNVIYLIHSTPIYRLNVKTNTRRSVIIYHIHYNINYKIIQ